ncbi:magnesium chelatase subunit D [Tabrizicola sp. J26]|uniref:magnesium chelatase subunit D n=1 Tax=Alitabrizicola rongguiensis TaxID=2909234 RepID=UPI001F362F22|nr:magnesium chelatase subunit D [Tabrizicola rongguiensis]MCF1710660.1 magnesium chelatase subunit D [Tabrizicola rongguiensis]
MTAPLSPLDRAEAALAVLAVDPAGVKGLWLRARSGPLRDRIAEALLATRRIHPGIDDTSLFGGVDLAATLASGHVQTSAGLLTETVPITLTMAERCPPGLAVRLGRWLDGDGTCLVALDESAEQDEGLPSALSDRLGLFIDLEGMVFSETTPLRPDPAKIAEARARLSGTALPSEATDAIARLSLALGVASLRAPLLALKAAVALAAWRGEASVSEETLRHAAELTLAHRGVLSPAADEPEEPPPPPEPDETPSDQSLGAEQKIPEEVLLEAVQAALPDGVLAQLAAGKALRAARGGGGTGAARKGNHRGRPLPSRPGMPGSGKRIDLVATLRAAAPWQPLRRRAPAGPSLRLEIRPSDLRLKRFEECSDRVLVFAVDASGSSAFARLAEAKGAVELLLAQAYARRDHVALIAFRGTGAELLLPPTRSLVQTKRRLAGLPGGGGTPLASGLRMAFDLGLQTRRRGMTPTIALLTDGRGNVALDGSANRAAAETDALRVARTISAASIPSLVLDIANRPQPALQQLARSLGAGYVPLPRADAQRLTAVLQSALDT